MAVVLLVGGYFLDWSLIVFPLWVCLVSLSTRTVFKRMIRSGSRMAVLPPANHVWLLLRPDGTAIAARKSLP